MGNIWEVEPGEVLGSKEVHGIAVAIGADPGPQRLEGLRYGKICILADADSDGRHIATLLCALFVPTVLLRVFISNWREREKEKP